MRRLSRKLRLVIEPPPGNIECKPCPDESLHRWAEDEASGVIYCVKCSWQMRHTIG